MLKKELTSGLGAVGLAALIVFGCSPDSTGSRLVTVQISLARADVATSAASAPQLVTSGVIDPTSVDKIDVKLDAVELSTSGSGWQRVSYDPALDLDLASLPLDGSPDAINLGKLQVEDGTCEVRLFVSSVQFTFISDVVIGGQTITAGTTVDATIPSGPQTGVKVDGVCQVPSTGGDVKLVFDENATLGTIVATGGGKLMLTPVIHIAQQ